jgi:hypothetical protein
MPTVNIYYENEQSLLPLQKSVNQLKKFVASKLSGSDIELGVDEISVRLVKVTGDGMLAPVEVEIKAANFKDRVEKQDQICLDIQKFLAELLGIEDVKVWLILSELGHSWENT